MKCQFKSFNSLKFVTGHRKEKRNEYNKMNYLNMSQVYFSVNGNKCCEKKKLFLLPHILSYQPNS